MAKKQFGKYYLGFDIGTDSVGWAVTDMDYNVLKFNNKSMWGIHLFESGKTAEERRTARCARRRTARLSQRLSLLQSLFKEEIDKIDKDFFQRLSDSKFYADDKEVSQTNTLFNDVDFNDKVYYSNYPTIYHLRSALIHSNQSFDIRLVYLALHHIIKHRGHFLFEGQNFESVTSFTNVFNDLITTLNDYDIHFDYTDSKAIEEILKNRYLNITEKKNQLSKLMNSDTKQKKSISDLLSGGKVSLSAIFEDDSLNECELTKISFADGIDENIDILTDILEERMFVISKLKAVYDWSILINILQNQKFLSDAKIQIYQNHKKDLTLLKKMIKKYLSNNDYNEILKSIDNKNNYCSYLGKSNKDTCTQEDFCKYLKNKFENINLVSDDEKMFIESLENHTAFPKQVTKDNGVIPYQLHLYELKAILKNAENYLPFLLNKDENGLTVSDKIISILTFRIPYYVGPLNKNYKHAWIVKRKDEKIYPWNFDEIVDKQASADKFIINMTNKCTYLVNQYVLPKNSLLYSKYNILNQLNNIRVNGEKIPVYVKQSIFNDLFLSTEKCTKITISKLKLYFKNKGYFADFKDIDITGIDNEIVGNLKAYFDFKKIFETNIPDTETIDNIIKKITVLGESKNLLNEYLKNIYGNIFTEKQISEISKLNYTGWGRLSREFLTDIYHTDKESGECKNIITLLYETNNNLMQLLSNEFDFTKRIEEFNDENSAKITRFSTSLLDDLYASPAVKRGIWRTLMLCKEIVKITGHEPTKIFIEMARGEDENNPKGKKTPSKKNKLIELYKKSKVEEQQLLTELENADEGELRDNRLYLYYTQMGRCMYSGERINISDIYTLYDIDHIYPQSKVKDDSISANKVLVKRTLNADKGDAYPIPERCVSSSARSLWKTLLDKDLITKEKYSRLTRKTPFNNDELSGFIARQIVETRQSTKAVANILNSVYPKSKIVYVKASNVSNFRHDYGIVKSRLVNDYHHAKDAYLNIVVGNVYYEKFTNNPLTYIKNNPKYSMNKIFEYPVIKGDKTIWESTNGKSISVVKKQVNKNNILFTRYATTYNGLFFDQMPVKAGKGQLPLKTSDERLHNTERYGAYNSIKGSYFFLAEHTNKNKIVKTIEFVPVYLAKNIRNTYDLKSYAENNLKLSNVRILLPKIKINTLFKVNGFYMHLSGRTGNQIIFKGAMPLVVSNNLYEYVKKIEKYIERNRKEKTVLPITIKHQKISADKNLELYDELLHKLKNTIYNVKLSSQVPTFENGREKFSTLDLPKQCEFLYNAIKLFGTSSSATDLSLVGGSKNAGILLISSNINNCEQISIINQSVTGLFAKEINLKAL